MTPELKILREEDFLFYEEPKAFEETGVTKKFAKFLRQEYGYGKKELFLMETSRSCDADVKGSTFCAGIAPMGDVYLCLGTMHPANFEPSEAVHKMVRQKLGLPLEGPLDLSTADQARFAEEVVRRIDALGKFKHVGYGGS